MSQSISLADKAKLLNKQRQMNQTSIDKKGQDVLKDKSKDFLLVEKVESYDQNDDYDFLTISTEDQTKYSLGKKSADELQKERSQFI
jgi:hypothetical protein